MKFGSYRIGSRLAESVPVRKTSLFGSFIIFFILFFYFGSGFSLLYIDLYIADDTAAYNSAACKKIQDQTGNKLGHSLEEAREPLRYHPEILLSLAHARTPAPRCIRKCVALFIPSFGIHTPEPPLPLPDRVTESISHLIFSFLFQ